MGGWVGGWVGGEEGEGGGAAPYPCACVIDRRVRAPRVCGCNAPGAGSARASWFARELWARTREARRLMTGGHAQQARVDARPTRIPPAHVPCARVAHNISTRARAARARLWGAPACNSCARAIGARAQEPRSRAHCVSTHPTHQCIERADVGGAPTLLRIATDWRFVGSLTHACICAPHAERRLSRAD